MPTPNTEMNDRNDTIAPSHPNVGTLPVRDPILNQESVQNRQATDSIRPGSPMPPAEGNENESIRAVVSEVEEFTRGWIGRIRRLIHRSSQLIERESLLAGAIARLDQQKSEWTKRTAAKEQGLRDQSKKLTEAWLEVESERRKAIQGARAAATATNKPNGGPVLAAPVGPLTGSQPTVQPAVAPAVAPTNPGYGPQNPHAQHPYPQQAIHQHGPVQHGPVQHGAVQHGAGSQPGVAGPMPAQPAPAQPAPAQPAPAQSAPAQSAPAQSAPAQSASNQPAAMQMPAAPPQVNPPINVNVPVAGHNPSIQNNAVMGNVPAHSQGMPVPNAPIRAGGSTLSDQKISGDDAFGQAEAATRQKIEEFRRMQRAIRSNRNT